MPEIQMTPEEFAASVRPAEITGFLIDVYMETASVVTVVNNFKAFRKLLDCDCIAIEERYIGRKTRMNSTLHRYDIVCDDNALAREPVKISAIDSAGAAMLVGDLFIVRHNSADGEGSLTQEDIAYLKDYILLQGTIKFPKPYPMLHQCEYC